MLEQKVAVVTGASRGIGSAIAKKLAEDGMFVVINYRGNKEQAESVKQEILENQGMAEIYACDVSDMMHVKHFLKQWFRLTEGLMCW